MNEPRHDRVRLAVAIAACANLAYFGVEFAVARHIGSVSLLADSVDFLEDASINLLILLSLGLNTKARARVGALLAVIILLPAISLIWTAIGKFQHFTAPDALSLSATGCGALVVNLGCAMMLAHVRHARGSLTRAAFLSARNDVVANVAIIFAGITTAAWLTPWPDLVVGIGIVALNIDAARDILSAARTEHRAQP